MNLENAIRVRRKPRTKSGVPAEKHGTWRNLYPQARSKGQGHVLFPYRSMGNASTLFEEVRGARISGRFRSIDAHAAQKNLCSAEMETIRVSRNSYNGDNATRQRVVLRRSRTSNWRPGVLRAPHATVKNIWTQSSLSQVPGRGGVCFEVLTFA